MISTIINYCSIDYRFINKNISECLKFSDKVIVPICDHLFDGTPEDFDVVDETVNLFADEPNLHFVEYRWQENGDAKFHHNLSRWMGLHVTETDYVLFLDADELIEGDVMLQYVNEQSYKHYDVGALKCYWYFREPIYRATNTEMAGVIYKKSLCTESMIFHKEERWAFRDHRKKLDIQEDVTYNGIVMCNHYSWVRSKEEMLKKVTAWGHSTEKNWLELVEDEFNRPFNGTDFIHGYSFETVDNKL